ncbi:MAG: hypothetical protein AUJ28_03280 [Parcubacteria group bacterium CG1_02_37_51]|uniref:Uncharacterized protein n=2 Tax=Candidatus Komeiliibacteriota TaxID=1817908 RepID=A0A2M8DQ55_9BACT|nr:MAG: hypothetical protein AUJ28_03280 [Parcubacteria group bacterium CG1_02_37_51]PIY94367.1 MAG: hypothetical protein COY67_02600 [Candidatus Komeilibacteria bacterium CG_4_10_14_0_8_um_filter_37_78]PJC01112.1 MAG: hypothetical protein CO073_04290 [Candidatus Komeilibacteria bacterium CG_4_9_14_0_8_um_filter_36_9]
MKKIIIASILIVISLTSLVFVYWWQRGDALLVQLLSNFQDDGRGSINQENIPPLTTQSELQAQENIKAFMNNSELTIQYISSSKNPSNFTIGKVASVDDAPHGVSGAWRIDTPAEWDRPVHAFQQSEYIDELCEVYEYEIDARNNQLVEVHVRYPEIIQELSLDEKKEKCNSLGSLYGSVRTETEIKNVAMTYLGRSIPRFDQLKPEFIYKSSKENPVNIAAAHEWIWQDTSYKLPEGLTGDVYNYPTIRIIVSSGGKLIYYFNSVGLFKN